MILGVAGSSPVDRPILRQRADYGYHHRFPQLFAPEGESILLAGRMILGVAASSPVDRPNFCINRPAEYFVPILGRFQTDRFRVGPTDNLLRRWDLFFPEVTFVEIHLAYLPSLGIR